MVSVATHVFRGLTGPLLGIELCYFNTMHIFLAHIRAHKKSDVFYAVFSSVVFALITLCVAVEGMFDKFQIKTTQAGRSHTH